VGDRLREARRKAGLSQFRLAVRAGCTPQAIGQYEHGACPRGDILIRIAAALDMRPEDLMPGTGGPRASGE